MSEQKRVAIMQPYFLPYIGYWQLINAVDCFVIYDTIEFTKKGWVHRNRLLQNNTDQMFSLALEKASDYLAVVERRLSADSVQHYEKLLRKFAGAYQKAPYFAETMPLLERIFRFEDKNLFRFIFNSIELVCQHLSITTPLLISSDIEQGPLLKGQDRVKNLCHQLQATDYINSIGGQALYSKTDFAEQGLQLHFQRVLPFDYRQFGEDFLPWLSIVDVLMFNSVDNVKRQLDKMELC
ncbi:WbqC family protein [Rheinheimera baltica]|uniref:WbqC family protein n=1 Tax=Rheinheimera baltica TaxID=67576 RepID=UPI00042A51A9|nr:WbqC family protein [Rheinheimera baltica]